MHILHVPLPSNLKNCYPLKVIYILPLVLNNFITVNVFCEELYYNCQYLVIHISISQSINIKLDCIVRTVHDIMAI